PTISPSRTISAPNGPPVRSSIPALRPSAIARRMKASCFCLSIFSPLLEAHADFLDHRSPACNVGAHRPVEILGRAPHRQEPEPEQPFRPFVRDDVLVNAAIEGCDDVGRKFRRT